LPPLAAVLALLLAVAAGGEVLASLPGAEPFAPELRARLESALAARGEDYEPRTHQKTAAGEPRFTNRLLLEASPYLRQHAHNPVDWRPWGPEAFEAARRLDRPVLVSIGYSTCHWCHVMEELCFDVPAIAEVLNRNFVAIKVDREVRPDVDAIYMAALHAMRGNGGWPLNVWLTPDGQPFFGGTYFPPEDAPGRPGFVTVLETIHRQWTEDRDEVGTTAERLAALVRGGLRGAVATSSRPPQAEFLHHAMRYYARAADREWGGLGHRTKFPATLPVRLLLRYHRRTGDVDALELATLTLDRMATGGMRDHLGGGFHRYAVDRRWQVPHFEKMLYDNALLAVAYLEAWQQTGRPLYAGVVRETLDFVSREMTAPEGGFYSALDADSVNAEGELEEGFFYTWTPAELLATLGPVGARRLGAWYGVTPDGQVEGRSVLHTWGEPGAVASRLGLSGAALEETVAAARPVLLRERARRTRPLRDEKRLAAWNGLMISAFARAGLALGEPEYVATASRAAGFVLGEMRPAGRLVRVHDGEQAAGTAFLEDHAFLIAGLLDLYEATGETRWLRDALQLQSQLEESYADEGGGGYFRTPADHERLLVREKPDRDGAVPAGNSVAVSNLLRLHQLTLDAELLERAGLVFSAFHGTLERQPAALPEMLLAVEFQLDTPKEVAIVAPEGAHGLAELLAPLRSAFLPNRALAIAHEGPDLAAQASLVPWLRYKVAEGGSATAYVCENQVCDAPTNDPAVFAAQLGKVEPLPTGSSP
jgi:uncharacterized protein YyaL (SSP411 family)